MLPEVVQIFPKRSFGGEATIHAAVLFVVIERHTFLHSHCGRVEVLGRVAVAFHPAEVRRFHWRRTIARVAGGFRPPIAFWIRWMVNADRVFDRHRICSSSSALIFHGLPCARRSGEGGRSISFDSKYF